MEPDRGWMYNRFTPRNCLNDAFIRGVQEFIAFASSQRQYMRGDKIRCPCVRCKNSRFFSTNTVKDHLMKGGFVLQYKQWTLHGESYIHRNNEPNLGDSRATCEKGNSSQTTVTKGTGPELVVDNRPGEAPNMESQHFFDLLKDVMKPLWDGCKEHTCLSAISSLLNIKSEENMSEECFNRLIELFRGALPNDHKLPENFYGFMHLMDPLGLGYEEIDVCVNGCTLFYKDRINLDCCPSCCHPRFKASIVGKKRGKPEAYKKLRWLPLIPRLKRLYLSETTAEYMQWHKRHQVKDENVCHPSDSEAWKHFDKTYPDFASEPKNIRLGLFVDGFSLFSSSSQAYSCWPVIITPYNLPPWMSMKNPMMFLTLVIPGPKNPGKNIDIYLEPLIDELKELWEVGVPCYDVASKCNFKMRAALMWTISDFLTYGMLSGWDTQGRLSCPYCMENSKAFQLTAGRMNCFFDCHRQFLPKGSTLRRDKKNFLKGKVEMSDAPPILDGEQIWQHVRNYPKVNELSGCNMEGFGESHNWTKRSIFWDLPYWRSHLLRHNLDVMHIEKHVFDNILNTVMDVKGKTKDNVSARVDIEKFCDRPELCLKKEDGVACRMNVAMYTLPLTSRKIILDWVRELRLPDGYTSNLARCVDMKDLKLSHMKSHDCHVFMERLLPIALRELLPEYIWEAFTEMSLFFRDICCTSLQRHELRKMQENIVMTICNLEKILPPAFFDTMVHLTVHLIHEAICGGPVQYRWIHPFEMFLQLLERRVKDKARVEESICEAYIILEISTFCSYYFKPHVQTEVNNVRQNDQSVTAEYPFNFPGRPLGQESYRILDDQEFKDAHLCVLMCSQEVYPYLKMFEENLIKNRPTLTEPQIDDIVFYSFAKWLYDHLARDSGSNDRVKYISMGPSKRVRRWSKYVVNGYEFHTLACESTRGTMNSGVSLIETGDDSSKQIEYYGLVNDIIELEYHDPTGKPLQVVLFKCDWYDSEMDRGLKKHPKYGLIDINVKKKYPSYEPFAVATGVQQVYFFKYPGSSEDRANWWNVYKTKSRNCCDVDGKVHDIDEHSAFQTDKMDVPLVLPNDKDLPQRCHESGKNARAFGKALEEVEGHEVKGDESKSDTSMESGDDEFSE